MTDVAAILNQISDTLAKPSPSPEEVADLVTRTTATLLDSTCVLWLAEDGSEELTVAATAGPTAAPPPPAIEQPAGLIG